VAISLGFDPFKIIKAALKNGGDFADIYAEDTFNTSIVSEESRIEKAVTGRDFGCGIRVIAGFKTYYAYTNDLTEEGLLKACDAVSSGVRQGKKGLTVSLVEEQSGKGFAIKAPPRDAPLKKKADIVKRAEAVARSFDKRIRQVRVVYGDGFKSLLIANSEGRMITEERTSLIFLCQAIAAEGAIIQTGYEPIGGAMGMEAFEETPPEAVAGIAAKRAVDMLGARMIKGGRLPVILSSEAGGTMIHEAVGHGLEADLALENLSVYSGKLNEQVASPLVTVVDDATIPHKRGSFSFDDEGSPAQRTTLVDKGVLRSYMYDRLHAMKAGVGATGNGRRESYHFRPIPRMTNTIISPGLTPPQDIIRSVDKGLFVKKMGGGQVNTVNGDFMFEVSEGYVIENGKTGELVRGATLTGNGPEVLKAIDMVGSDLGFGIGTCGKDGQGVPVSDAQPTLRIPEMVVGGEAR
jgi:TldD protein